MYFIKPAYAQIINPVLPELGTGGQAAGGTIIGGLVGGLIALALILGTIAAFIFLILGALRWITSSGDKQQLESAQHTITNAIIGLVILAAVWAIMIIVSTFLGLGLFSEDNALFNLPIPTIQEILQGGGQEQTGDQGGAAFDPQNPPGG